MNEFGGLTFADRKPACLTGRHYFQTHSGGAFRALALSVALLGLAACKSPSERAVERAQQAEMLAQAGDMEGAQRAISEAIALREDGPGFQQLAGTIALQSGNPVGAYRAFQRVLEFDATNRLALAYVANLGVQIGRIGDADDAANRLLTIEPDALPALQAKGMIALSRDNLEEAEQFADRILARNPADEAGAIVKARALARTGRAEEAVALIDNALRTSGDSMALLSNKVNLHRYLRQPEPMAATLERLVERSKGNSAIKLDQINLLYKLGRNDEARQVSLALLREGARDPADYRLLQRIWWQYDPAPLPEGAARDSSAWADPLAIVQVARYLLARDDVRAASALLTSAPASAGDLVASLKLRVQAASNRDAQQVFEQVEALLERDAQDVDALMLKARFAQRRGDMRAAREAAQLAQVNDPRNSEAYILLADLYRAEGEDWRARQLFEEGFNKLPQNFHLVRVYTQYLHDLGDRERALSVARSFARGLPSSEQAWTLFLAQCRAARDEACARTAQSGLDNARTTYLVDDPPGTPVDRGLFGRI